MRPGPARLRAPTDGQSQRRALSARGLLAQSRALAAMLALGLERSELTQTVAGPLPQDLTQDRWLALFGESTAEHQRRLRREAE